MFPVSSCDGSRGSLGLGLVALRIPGERPGLPVSGVSGVRRPELLDPSGESSSFRAWYGLSASCQLPCPIVQDLWDSLATEGSIRGRGVLFGLDGGLFKLCLLGGSRPRGCSIEGDVAGDAVGDLRFGDTWSSFCCDGHTCSPMAEIWISAPQSEHLIDGRMLNGRSVSMAAGGGGRV